MSNLSPIEQFANQNFMLFDYLDLVDTEDQLQSHFDDLMTLCQNCKIGRLIIFIKDPSTYTFFQPGNSTGFVLRATQLYKAMLSIVPTFDISLLFTSVSFSSSAPTGTVPSVNPAPSTAFPTQGVYFTDIENMLDWAKAIIALAPCIKEICFDPEYSDPATQTSADKTIQQYVYNYADEYKWLNQLGSIRLGTTVGIDESKVTYANLSTFPVNPIYTKQIGFPPFPNPQPNWSRGKDVTVPLLQSVYVQCYETAISSLFAAGYNSQTGAHSGATAAKYFNSILRDLPYLQGTGTISFTKHAPTVTGTGTDFSTYSDALLFAYDSDISAVNKIGVVESISSPTSLNLGDPYASFSSVGSEPFSHTEIVTAWSTTQPVLTQEMLNNIYWMFSIEYTTSDQNTFFGNWQLSDFMDFINGVVASNNSSSTNPFTLNGDGTTFLTVPSLNYAIYDYNFATTTANTTPMNNGQVDPWNLL